jgi:hypothetical protein
MVLVRILIIVTAGGVKKCIFTSLFRSLTLTRPRRTQPAEKKKTLLLIDPPTLRHILKNRVFFTTI